MGKIDEHGMSTLPTQVSSSPYYVREATLEDISAIDQVNQNASKLLGYVNPDKAILFKVNDTREAFGCRATGERICTVFVCCCVENQEQSGEEGMRRLAEKTADAVVGVIIIGNSPISTKRLGELNLSLDTRLASMGGLYVKTEHHQGKVDERYGKGKVISPGRLLLERVRQFVETRGFCGISFNYVSAIPGMHDPAKLVEYYRRWGAKPLIDKEGKPVRVTSNVEGHPEYKLSSFGLDYMIYPLETPRGLPSPSEAPAVYVAGEGSL